MFRRTLFTFIISCCLQAMSVSCISDASTCTRPLVSQDCSLNNCVRAAAYARACSVWADDGHTLVYRPLSSVGNLMVALHQMYLLAYELEVALIVAVENFPALSVMLEPNLIPWHTIHHRRGKDGPCDSGTTSFVFVDGHVCAPADANVTRPHLIQYLASGGRLLRSAAENHEKFWRSTTTLDAFQDNSCFLRAMFRRTVAAEAYAAAQAQTWKNTLPVKYVSWHIRTGSGERPEYNISSPLYAYIHTEPAEQLCEVYRVATAEALSQLSADHSTTAARAVYLSTNSKQVAAACSTLAGQLNITLVYSDFSLPEGSMHTEGNLSPVAGMHALLDWLFLINSSYMAHSGSSFAWTAVIARGMSCDYHHVAIKLRTRGDVLACRTASFHK